MPYYCCTCQMTTTCNISLYVFDIRDFPETDAIDRSENSLSRLATDRDRVLQYHFRADRCRCLAGQLLVANFVGQPIIRSDIQAGNSSIKPVHRQGPMFNISHDEDLVVLATCEGFSIGIDLMRIKVSNPSVAVHEMLLNLRNIFTDIEWDYIQAGEREDGKLERFYQLWTGKEAYVKCLGTGLYTEPSELSLHGISQSLEEQDVQITHTHDEERSRMFRIRVSSKVLPGYVVTTCAGPVGACDPSWTKFLEPTKPKLPSRIEKLHIESLQQIRLSQLV